MLNVLLRPCPRAYLAVLLSRSIADHGLEVDLVHELHDAQVWVRVTVGVQDIRPRRCQGRSLRLMMIPPLGDVRMVAKYPDALEPVERNRIRKRRKDSRAELVAVLLELGLRRRWVRELDLLQHAHVLEDGVGQ